jgi:hypothetical protein
LDIFGDPQGTDQRAVLKQHAVTLDERDPIGAREVLDVRAVHLDAAGVGVMQPQYRSQQNGFSRTGAADHAEDLATANLEIEAVVHHLCAEAIDESRTRITGSESWIAIRSPTFDTSRRTARRPESP